MDQVYGMIACGILRPGATLPSVRQLAKQLAVNPMTLSKAYGKLEQEGILTRRPGIGMVVRDKPNHQTQLTQRMALLKPSLEQAALQAKQLDIPPQVVLKAFSQLLENEP